MKPLYILEGMGIAILTVIFFACVVLIGDMIDPDPNAIVTNNNGMMCKPVYPFVQKA